MGSLAHWELGIRVKRKVYLKIAQGLDQNTWHHRHMPPTNKTSTCLLSDQKCPKLIWAMVENVKKIVAPIRKTLQYDIAIRLFLGSLQYFNSPLGLWCDVLDTNLEVAISGHKREQIEGKLREINQSVFWSLSRHYPWDTWVLNFMRSAHHYFQVSFCCVCILLLIFSFF